jgi:predicted nucleotidyltransferase
MTKETILDYLTKHKKELQQKYQIEKIGIFGSYSRDEEKEHSDIDIFVKMNQQIRPWL